MVITEESYKDTLIKLQAEKIKVLEATIAQHTCNPEPVNLRPVLRGRHALKALEQKYARPSNPEGSTTKEV